MSHPRSEEPLTDAALDREIEHALSVEPSPEFVARVRSALATDRVPARSSGWLPWTGGLIGFAAATALLTLTASSLWRSTGGTGGGVPNRVSRPQAPPPQVLAAPPADPAPARRRQAAHTSSTRTGTVRVSAGDIDDLREVTLISRQEVEAWQAFFARLQQKRSEDAPPTLIPSIDSEPPAIEIAPINIQPLLDEESAEGEVE
jgi:hypothetical protein